MLILNYFLKRGRLAFGLFLIAFLLSAPQRVQAAELVMFESKGCEWCEAWHEEVGVIYDKTTEAIVVPLRIVDIDEDRPSDLSEIEGLVYTPTFVVMNDGHEIGRIIGYPGDDFFWQMLDEIIEKI